jgi:hypothetical protein
MHGGTCPHCGCASYVPDDGTDGERDPYWQWYGHGYRCDPATEGILL